MLVLWSISEHQLGLALCKQAELIKGVTQRTSRRRQRFCQHRELIQVSLEWRRERSAPERGENYTQSSRQPCIGQYGLGRGMATGDPGTFKGFRVDFSLFIETNGGSACCHFSGSRLAEAVRRPTLPRRETTERRHGKPRTATGKLSPECRMSLRTHSIGRSRSHGHTFTPPAGRGLK